jgi:hypothetical protein
MTDHLPRPPSSKSVARIITAAFLIRQNARFFVRPRSPPRFIGGAAIIVFVLQVFGHGEKVAERRDLFLAGRKSATVNRADRDCKQEDYPHK